MANRGKEVPAKRAGLSTFDPFFRDFFDDPAQWPSLFRTGLTSRGGPAKWAPAMDLTETDSSYAVTVELPGTQPDDIQVECHEHQLIVKGEKRSEREEKDEHRHYTERTFGSFSRSVRLPPDASDEVHAKFSDGVLTIEIPKADEKKPRTVVIQS
jgi:HSP20 family protein